MPRIRLFLGLATVLFVAAVIGFFGVFYSIVSDSHRRREFILDEIEGYFRSSEADVDLADVGPIQGGRLVIRDLVVRDKRDPEREFLRVARTTVELGGWLKIGSIERVEFIGVDLFLQRDRDGEWNFERLIDFDAIEDDSGAGDSRPKLTLHDSVVRIHDASFLAPGEVHSIALAELELTPEGPGDDVPAGTYFAHAKVADDILGSGEINGSWSLGDGTGKLELALAGARLDSDVAARFAEPVRDFLETFSIRASGGLAASIERDSSGGPLVYRVVGIVDDGSLQAEYLSEEPIRFSGRLRFAGGTLDIEDLHGSWDGRSVELSGTLSVRPAGLEGDFNLVLEEPRPNELVERLQGDLRRPFDLAFEEGERLRLECRVRRDAGSDRYSVGAVALARGGQAGPRRLAELRAQVVSRPDRFELAEAELLARARRIRIEGSMSGRISEPELELTFASHDWAIDEGVEEFLGSLDPGFSRLQDPVGRIELGVRLSRPGGPGGRLTTAATLLLEDAAFGIEGIDGRFEGVSARARVDGSSAIVIEAGRAKVAGADLELSECRLEPDGRGGYALSKLVGAGKSVPFEERFLSILPASARRIVVEFGFRGRQDVSFEVTRDPGAAQTLALVRVRPLGVSFRHVEFPLEISDLVGTVEYDERRGRVAIDVTGAYGAGSKVSLAGTVLLGKRSQIVEADLALDARNVAMSQGDFAVFSRGLSRILSTGNAENRFDITGEIAIRDSHVIRPNLLIRPLSVTLVYYQFAYPVEGVTGEIWILPEGLGKVFLEGRRGDVVFRLLHPTVQELASSSRRYSNRVAARIERVAAGPDLEAALPPELRASWSRFGLTGTVALEFELDREGEATDVDSGFDLLVRTVGETSVLSPLVMSEARTTSAIEIELAGAGIRYADFPYPLEDVSGVVRLRDRAIELAGLSGGRGDARFEIEGFIKEEPGRGMAVDLVARGDQVELDDELRGALPVDWREAWDSFSPSGRVSLDLRLEKRHGEEREALGGSEASGDEPRGARRGGAFAGARTWAEIRPLDVSLAFDSFPIPLEVVGGSVVLGDGSGPVFRDIEARCGEGWARIEGRLVEYADGRRIELAADLEGIPVDERLRPALDERFPGLWETLEPSGVLDRGRVEICAVSVPEGGYHVDYRLEGGLVDASMRLAARVEGASGRGTAKGWIRGGEHHLTEGYVHDLRFDLAGLGFRRLGARLSMEGPILVFSDLRGDCLGGSLEGRMDFDTGPLHAFEGAFEVDRVDLARLARRLGPGEEEPEEGTSRLEGSLKGRARIAGALGDVDSLRGTGYLEVEGGRLWDLPVFLAIFDVFELPGRPAFRNGRTEFTLAQRKVRLTNARLDSNPMVLYGEGTMDLGGELDLYFAADLAPGMTPRVPVVSRYWEKFKKNMIPIRVSGSFDEPEAAVVPFRLFQDMIASGGTGR